MNEITRFNNLPEIATHFRKDLMGENRREKDLILLFAHNGTGKTRLSMEFKKLGKTNDNRDTLYFNALRSILEKTCSFFGYDKIDKCIHGLGDDVLFERALQLFSHRRYSVFDPIEMGDDNKDLFKRILTGFLSKYEFYLPEIFGKELLTEAT